MFTLQTKEKVFFSLGEKMKIAGLETTSPEGF